MNDTKVPVPWVALWTSERDKVVPVTVTTAGIDGPRDAHGVYWMTFGDSPGVGEPLFGHVHTGRQVRCMRKCLCQVCGKKIRRDRCHWILNGVESELLQEGKPHQTQTPPVCSECIKVALEYCPHLASLKKVTILTVTHYRSVGVLGDLALPGREVQKQVGLPYGDPRLRYFIGRQLWVELISWERREVTQKASNLEPSV